MPLLSTRFWLTSQPPVTGTKLYCLMTEAHVFGRFCWSSLPDRPDPADTQCTIWLLRIKVKCAVHKLLHIAISMAVSLYIGANTTVVCDAWPVRRQTYSYLPSSRRYQFIPLGNKVTCVCTCKRLTQGCTRQYIGRDLNPQHWDCRSATPGIAAMGCVHLPHRPLSYFV